MSIPRQLLKSFDTIRNSQLVLTKDPSDENIREFGKAINQAIPDSTNHISYMIYKFMRGMYLHDREKFIQYINGMSYYESMILWTDYLDILAYFDLSGVIFLGWNKATNKYQAAKVDPTKTHTEYRFTHAVPAHIERNSTKEHSDFRFGKSASAKPTKHHSKYLLEQSVNAPNSNLSQDHHVATVEQCDDYEQLYQRIAQIQASRVAQGLC